MPFVLALFKRPRTGIGGATTPTTSALQHQQERRHDLYDSCSGALCMRLFLTGTLRPVTAQSLDKTS